jgi:hypothetical protein
VRGLLLNGPGLGLTPAFDRSFLKGTRRKPLTQHVKIVMLSQPPLPWPLQAASLLPAQGRCAALLHPGRSEPWLSAWLLTSCSFATTGMRGDCHPSPNDCVAPGGAQRARPRRVVERPARHLHTFRGTCPYMLSAALILHQPPINLQPLPAAFPALGNSPRQPRPATTAPSRPSNPQTDNHGSGTEDQG